MTHLLVKRRLGAGRKVALPCDMRSLQSTDDCADTSFAGDLKVDLRRRMVRSVRTKAGRRCARSRFPIGVRTKATRRCARVGDVFDGSAGRDGGEKLTK